jgi:hypothetical protein
MVTTEVQAIVDLINQVNLVAIPAIVGLITGVLSIANHFRNSKKITDLSATVNATAGKVEGAISSNMGNVSSGLDLISRLSPEAKDALVKTHPVVVDLQTKVNDATKKIAELQAYIDQLKGTGGVVAAAT